MNKMRILFVEDQMQERDRYARWIIDAWKEFRPGFDIALDKAADYSSAVAKLDEAAYELLITDIVLTTDGNNRDGVLVINHAKKKDASIAIFVLTGAGGSYIGHAMKAGAHGFLAKDAFASSEGDPLLRLFEGMRRALLAAGKPDYPIDCETQLKFDVEDVDVNAMLSVVGGDTILLLMAQLYGRPCSRVTPTYIPSGASGSMVLVVECQVDSRPKETILLKLDRNEAVLRNEYDRRDRLGVLHRRIRPEYREIPPSELVNQGWYALAASFEPVSCSLVDRLCSGRSGSKTSVSQIFHRLFYDSRTLRDAYRETRAEREIDPVSCIRQVVSVTRRAKVKRSLVQLSAFQSASRDFRIENFQLQTLLKFVVEGEFGGIKPGMLNKSCNTCWNHGDLHGRNILVDKMADLPVVIDPGNVSDILPMGADLCRLGVDVLLRGWDAGPLSHFWDSVAEWLGITNTLLLGQPLEREAKDGPNQGVASALDWMNENFDEIVGLTRGVGFPRWQLSLLHAAELLRCCSLEDLAMPKRFVAMLGAYNALALARREMPLEALTKQGKELLGPDGGRLGIDFDALCARITPKVKA